MNTNKKTEADVMERPNHMITAVPEGLVQMLLK